MELNEVAKLFGINDVLNITEISGGHINNTFLTECRNGRYILQVLNRDVFNDPEALMKNISKLEKLFAGSENYGVKIPEFLHAEDGNNYVEFNNEIYRMYNYAESAADVPDKFTTTGVAFGRFIRKLGERNIKLEKTIENFHNYSVYFSNLVTADKNSSMKKIDRVIMQRLDSLGNTLEQVFTVDFPKRNIHGDAKISNLIFSEKCTIIDLDTVMKSYAAIDYGDMIRSVCTAETVDFSVIRDITKGFAEGLEGVLSEDEIYSLYYGILYVTGELAVRYLIDYLSDEKYFKDKTSYECLSRANELLRQLRIFISGGDEITAIIYSAFKKK